MVSSDYDSLTGGDDVTASGANKVVFALTLILAAFFAWSYFFSVEEVSSGPGTVVPLSHEQVIQSFDGGILAELNVSTGQLVDKNEVLAEFDPTRAQSQYDETAARYRAALAQAVRLQAEVVGADHVSFPAALDDYPELTASEEALFKARQGSYRESLGDMRTDMDLIEQQLKLTEPLIKTGAASKVELIRLQRDMADIKLKMDDMRSKYMIENGEKLAEAQAQVATLLSSLNGLEDTLSHTVIRSPVHGIVKEINVTTIGGVVSPNGALMTIVPVGDQLRIEARISPRDIAFIHPGQEALVKITAYDYSIYGGLEGSVENISPDTIRDEINPENLYYRVYIRTASDALVNEAGKRFPITPGMVAAVDIKTGEKTIWDYLIKPLNRGREALRER
ncbi:HlyD family type I secretion periplasmic adaptor subunit [Martelella soudanensis]|uniref:HlyD family type I secretion periplasmic adaptor subunit n=1 Tax=unclassified Martelella TaxID=2629616 RepID=UPI0015DFCF7C|nr:MULTISPECIES: HlyD family type I secretion periplasmic adaptor subunit [unclassified Martelella]